FFCSLLAPSDAILFQEGVSVKLRLPHLVCKNVLRLVGELSIVLVLDDFQPLPILYNFSGIIQHTGKTE
ncbi:hypothetical protein, partial [Escherichia coli]|uniref:hypothetical protein n=1 Tax=Escherichia coli TaxID=562 RepID=UPI001A7E09A1